MFEAYIGGLVQAAVAKINQPASASDSKVQKMSPSNRVSNRQLTVCLMGSSSVLTLQVRDGEHAAARQRMGS